MTYRDRRRHVRPAKHEDASLEGLQGREDAGEDGAASGFVSPSRSAAAAPATERVAAADSSRRPSDGDGAPPLRSATLYHIAAAWEEFGNMRAAARALSQKSRLRNALSIVENSVRVALAAAALCADRSVSPATVLSREDDQHRLDTIQRAIRLHAHARAALMDCAGPLASDWFLSSQQVQAVMEAFGWVVGGGGDTSPAASSPAPMSPPRPVVQPFQQRVHLFLAAPVSSGGGWYV